MNNVKSNASGRSCWLAEILNERKKQAFDVYRELHGNLSLRSVRQARVAPAKWDAVNKEVNLGFI